MSNGFSIVCGALVVLLLGSAYSLWATNETVAKAKASINWPTTQAKILESSDSLRYTPRNISSASRYDVHMRYEYEVGGKDYSSQTAYFHLGKYFRQDAEKIVNDYAPGQMRPCYYNPSNPSVACLFKPDADDLEVLETMSRQIGLAVLILLVSILVVVGKKFMDDQSTASS